MGSTWSSTKKISEVHVHFNRKKLRVTFAPGDYNADKHVPLQQFRTKLAKALDVPATSLTLYQLNPQKRLANMSATLEDYGIRNGADILAVQAEADKPQPAVLTPAKKIENIVAEVETELGPRIASFTASPPADFAERDKENRILCETVLAKTIALDNVEVETPEERTQRKQAIAKLQTYHRNIDQAMARASEPAKDPEQPQQPESAEPQTQQPESAEPVESTEPQPVQSAQSEQPTPELQSEQPTPELQTKQPTESPQPASKPRKNKKKNKKR